MTPQTSRQPTAVGHSGARRPQIDADAVMRIKNLQLRARTVVEGFYNGLHRSPLHGFSAEFSEYRQYTAGDDPRFLDWRLYARTDRYYIKRFEDETNRHCYLLVDLSRSMGYGSIQYTKADYARTLAATLAYYLTLQRDCVGLLTHDDRVREYLPARHRTGHLRTILGLLERAEQGAGTDVAAAIEQIANLVKKRGLIVVISDFLTDVSSLARPLSYLRSIGHEVLVLRVLDPMEVSFDFTEPSRFRDLESDSPMNIDPRAAKRGYQERFAAHQAELADVCATIGVQVTQILTNDRLDQVLYYWLAHQIHQGGVMDRSRHRSRSGGPR